MRPRRLRWRVGAALGALAVVAIGVAVVAWRSGSDRAQRRRDVAAVEPVAAPPAEVRRPRPVDVAVDTTSGTIDGSVLDAVTRRGVAGAELTLLGDGAAVSAHTGSDGSFLMSPGSSDELRLATIVAPGYLPYVVRRGAPRLTLARGAPIHGVVFLLEPAVERRGRVIDAKANPVAGARVRVVSGPPSDLVSETATIWTTDREGGFTYQAEDDAILEARHGNARGLGSRAWFTQADGTLAIQIERAAPLDATITGHVRDPAGAPLADLIVRARPSVQSRDAPPAYATTSADGAFTLAGMDHAAYDLSVESDAGLTAKRGDVLGGTRGVELVVDPGQLIEGVAVDGRGAPVGVFTVIARWRTGLARATAGSVSVIDANGKFKLRVRPGDYELVALGRGCARSEPVRAAAGATSVRIVVGGTARLRGRVVARDDGAPIAGATVSCEFAGLSRYRPRGEASLVTAADGTFVFEDLTAGPVELDVRADGFHRAAESSLVAREGEGGGATVELSRVGPEERPRVEQVGLGLGLGVEGAVLRVMTVDPNGSAFDVGVQYGDLLVAIDGLPVGELALEGALARLRGVEGTAVVLDLVRDGAPRRITATRRRYLAW